MAPHAALVSVSDAQRSPKPHLPWVATCANALDLSRYPLARSEVTISFFWGA